MERVFIILGSNPDKANLHKKRLIIFKLDNELSD